MLNPSYKAMDLFGSEYWTYSLPTRCGAKIATELTSKSAPVSANEAEKMGAIDDILCQSSNGFGDAVLANVAKIEISIEKELQRKADHISDDFILEISRCRQKELQKMRESFANDT